jgi:hypothetical protein
LLSKETIEPLPDEIQEMIETGLSDNPMKRPPIEEVQGIHPDTLHAG